MDFQMMCETLARQIFQCGRFQDPLGRLANTDRWNGLHSDVFSERHRCQAWAILSRLQTEYLDSVNGREELYEQAEQIEETILNATTNQQIIDAMHQMSGIVEALNLSEFPHIDYKSTNDN